MMSLDNRLAKLESLLRPKGQELLILRRLSCGRHKAMGLEDRLYTLDDIEDMKANGEQGLSPKTKVIVIVTKQPNN